MATEDETAKEQPSGRGCAMVILGVPLLLFGGCGAYIALSPSQAERDAAERRQYEAESERWTVDVEPLSNDRYSTGDTIRVVETPDFTVSAYVTVRTDSNRTPLMHAVVELADGSDLVCETPRAYLSGSGEVRLACEGVSGVQTMYLVEGQEPVSAVLGDGFAP